METKNREDNINLREKRVLRYRRRISAAYTERERHFEKQERQQMVNNYFTKMLLRIQETFPKEVTYKWSLEKE